VIPLDTLAFIHDSVTWSSWLTRIRIRISFISVPTSKKIDDSIQFDLIDGLGDVGSAEAIRLRGLVPLP